MKKDTINVAFIQNKDKLKFLSLLWIETEIIPDVARVSPFEVVALFKWTNAFAWALPA